MSTSVLVINCGSSSIKYALVSERREDRIFGLAENLGSADARIKGITAGGQPLELSIPHADHEKALETILERLSHYNPQAIGHRVVHGGTLTKAELLTEEIVERIRAATPLAPLHNPAHLVGIDATMRLFPELPQVAVFDTAFHQTMPAHAYRYAVPKFLYTEHNVRRYGFHGTSHAYVSERGSELAGSFKQGGWLTAHLGNGSSTCAIWNGQSVDTSMGLTPLEGVVMGTRSGDLDPAILFYLARKRGLTLDDLDKMLNKESGLKGICGNNDMREISRMAEEGDEKAQLARDMFIYRLKKYIGSYSAVLGRVDCIVFTGGIGENDSGVRLKACANLENLGIKIDPRLNEMRSSDIMQISTPDSKVKVLVIPTNEELEIAIETLEMIEKHHTK